MAYQIIEKDCVTCGACEPKCPVECISELTSGARTIEESSCIDCGNCAETCPVGCIYPVE